MQPSLLLAAIAGGASGVFTFVVTGAGLVATPSPGSIFALSAMAPRGGLLQLLLGVVILRQYLSWLQHHLLRGKRSE